MAEEKQLQPYSHARNFEATTHMLATKLRLEVPDVRAFCAAIRNVWGKVAAREEDFFAGLAIAAQYGLNPLRREIHMAEFKGTIAPIVGVDGWIRIAQQHPQFAGYTFTEHQDGRGAPTACTCTLYRKDWQNPVVITERVSECAVATNPLWQRMPGRMIRNRALIQAVRAGLGVTGLMYADEEEIVAAQDAKVITPEQPKAANTQGRVDDMKARMAASRPAEQQDAAISPYGENVVDEKAQSAGQMVHPPEDDDKSAVAPPQNASNGLLDAKEATAPDKSAPSGAYPENAQDAVGTQSAPKDGPPAAKDAPAKPAARAGGGRHPSGYTEDPDSLFAGQE